MIRKFGRVYVPDARDLKHPMTRHLYAAPQPRTTPWVTGPILDQGATSQCTAYAWRAWKNAEPDPEDPGSPPPPAEFYSEEQAIDGIPGPHDGSTVRAGAEIVREEGLMGEYVWATHVVEMEQWLLTYSPVVLGVNWYSGMDSPSPEAIVSVDGEIRGGHAFLCYWYDTATSLFWCQNSWGTGFGKNGLFAIPESGMERLLTEYGEACGMVKLNRSQPVQPVIEKPGCFFGAIRKLLRLR